MAARYDDSDGEHFDDRTIQQTVAVLAELADGGPVVEFAVGTGRIALPLARSGIRVAGIDFSEVMLEQLRGKPNASLVELTLGDMIASHVTDDASLVYLLFNSIMNLRSQEDQVACFANAAAHLAPGGAFVVECMVPELHRLPAGERILPFDISAEHLGFDEYIDPVAQILVSHHVHLAGDQVRRSSPAFRYVWPSELDLMARLAGMELESRWSNWWMEPFTGDSPAHISVWRRTS